MLMGQSNGSDWWVRPVGHTDGSNQGGQSDGSDQLVSQVCHMSGSERNVGPMGETNRLH